jgi:hypothetical protein
MSIRQRQIRNAIDSIIASELKGGQYPTLAVINARLREYFSRFSPGSPSMQLRLWPYRQTSNPDDFNKTQEEVYQDLSDLYAETADQTLQLLEYFDYSEMERRRLAHHLRELERQIDELLIRTSNTDGYLTTFYDTFDNLSRIDTGHSTASVDLRFGQVTLPTGPQDQMKLDLSEAEATFSCLITPESSKSPIVSNKALSPLAEALDDSLNTAWLQEVVIEPKILEPTKVTGEVTIRLPKPAVVNSIYLALQSPKPVQVGIQYSEDGSEFTAFPSTDDRRIVYETSWVFPETKAQYFKITMTKWEPDSVDNADRHIYVFGLKEIAAMTVVYAEQAELYTRPIEIPQSSTALALYVDDHVPEGTSINYYIANYESDRELDDLVWQEVFPIRDSSEKPYKLQYSTTRSKTVSGSDATDGGMDNGIIFYKLDCLPSDPNAYKLNSLRLYRGYNQWIRKTFFMGDDIVREEPNHEPRPSDWYGVKYNETYVDLDTSTRNELNFSGINSKLGQAYKFTTHVCCREYHELVAGTMNVPEFLNVVYFVNGKKIASSLKDNQDSLTISLKQGWNTIEVLAYQKAAGTPELRLFFPLHKLLDATDVMIYASQEPMVLVDPYVLRYNTPPHVTNRYAVENNQILLNHDPSKIRFKLTYEELPGLDSTKKIFRISLRRHSSNNTLTPYVNEYRLRVI